MTFTLKIKLGNAAMLTGEDVAETLSRLVTSLTSTFPTEDDLQHVHGTGATYLLRDGNGNRVGSWSVE